MEDSAHLIGVAGDARPQSRLMTEKIDKLQNIPVDRALKVNADGTGNYRVEYDEPSWKLLLERVAKVKRGGSRKSGGRCVGFCASEPRPSLILF